MTDDEVLALLGRGNEARAAANAAFREAYDGAETEVAKCWAAHMVAVEADSPAEKLDWNMVSLRAAEAAEGDPRAPSLLPTVLANIGYSTLLMARPAEARSWYVRALDSLAAAGLDDDGHARYETAMTAMLSLIDGAGRADAVGELLDGATGE